MSFVEAFYSFKIALNDTHRDVYSDLRLKLAKHPAESMQHLYARLIAFLHSYEDQLKFSEGLFQPKEPTIWQKDILGNILIWIEVGCPNREKMMRALKHTSISHFKVYFTNNEEIDAFCHHMRGSTTNWASNVTFNQINPDFLALLTPLAKSSSTLSATFVDNILYLVFDQNEFETIIQPIDIWEWYQRSIENVQLRK